MVMSLMFHMSVKLNTQNISRQPLHTSPPINQPLLQPTNQLPHQHTNQPLLQPTNQLPHQHTNQPLLLPINQHLPPLTNQPLLPPTSQPLPLLTSQPQHADQLQNQHTN